MVALISAVSIVRNYWKPDVGSLRNDEVGNSGSKYYINIEVIQLQKYPLEGNERLRSL